jgi:TetR/AcrR family transcriptional regulator
MGMLDRAWYAVQTQTVAVDRVEVIAALSDSIVAMGVTKS